MSPAPTSGTGVGYRSAAPAAVCPADAAAVVSGALPRGATGTDCGGLSNPGRMLTAYSWLASAASSAALMGRSLSPSTARCSLLVGMELVHGNVVEHGQRIVSQYCQRCVKGDQIPRDRRFVDACEPNREPRRLLADQARLEQANHALALFAGAHQDELRLALLHRHLVRRDDRDPAPGDELGAEQAHDDGRHAAEGGLTAERGDTQRVRKKEAGCFPDLGDQSVKVVGRRGAAERLDGLLGSRLGKQPVLGAVDQFGFLALFDCLDG